MNDPTTGRMIKGPDGKYFDPDVPNISLSGQQMQALAKNHADALAAIKRDVELRKWAVDQACGLAGSGGVKVDPVALGRQIHAFLVEGANEHPPG